MSVILMTREMGTLGKDVAREFAKRMNYTVVHHELAEQGDARGRKDAESEVYRFLEGSQQDLDAWRGNHGSGGYLTRQEVFEVALQGDVLIRGWGAARLLRSVPNVLSVRVCAPMEFRIAQMTRRLDIDESEARREIERNDAAHSGVLLRFFGADWKDPLNYDVVLNTGQLSVAVCTDILCDAAASPAFADSEAGRARLRDCMLEAKIRAALGADTRLARSGRHIHVSVDNSEVRLYGLVTDNGTRQEAERLVASQSGVRALHNEIARAGRFD